MILVTLAARKTRLQLDVGRVRSVASELHTGLIQFLLNGAG